MVDNANMTPQALIEEARRLMSRDAYPSALDCYEELDRRGLANAEHLMTMGTCYMHVRQRQDARKAWMRAVDLDPGHQAAIDALDQNFRGWRKTRPAPEPTSTTLSTSMPAEAGPPPPPPPSLAPASANSNAWDLSAETILPPDRMATVADGGEETILSSSTSTGDSSFSARGPAPTPAPPFGTSRPSSGVDRQQAQNQSERVVVISPSMSKTTVVSPNVSVISPRSSTPSGVQPAVSELPPINWNFIMTDVMDEAGSTRRS
jgi:hypothetical protein